MFRQVVAGGSRISSTMFARSPEFLMQQCFRHHIDFHRILAAADQGRENFATADAPDDVSVAMMTA
jgi:hypothetical protein